MTRALLDRQLRRLDLDPATPPSAEQWSALLDVVRKTYGEAEQDRYTLERSLDLTSQEMQELNGNLRRALREAEASSRTKGDFLAMMSHEVRTPLNGVLAVAELLLDTPLDARQRGDVYTILRAGGALLGILNSILDFSKIEAGMLELDMIEFDLAYLIDTQVAMIGRGLSEKRLTLNLEVQPGVSARHRGDPGRLGQVLLNLLSNAVKFTPPDGEICLRVCAPRWGRLRCTVSDTGIGISQDTQRKLFQPFTQADSSTTRVYGGTGLGLSISKRLIALMGGEIGVESAAGQGATFWFEVPLSVVTAGSDRAQEPIAQARTDTRPPPTHTPSLPPRARPASVAPAPSGRPPGQRVILVAEDNPVNRMIIVRQLKKLGFHAEVAGDGAEAVTMVVQHTYDAVLMDCQMPEMSGYEATRRIRHWEATERRSRVPIVALTANAMQGDADRCLAAGMDDYLTKPIRQDTLLEGLSRWLAR